MFIITQVETQELGISLSVISPEKITILIREDGKKSKEYSDVLKADHKTVPEYESLKNGDFYPIKSNCESW
jgi:hypothetical protein